MSPTSTPASSAAAPLSRDEILRRLRERMVGFAASRFQRDVAEDVAQEVLIVLEQKYAHLDRAEDLLAVALQILRFKMASLHRKLQRRGEYRAVDVEETDLADSAVDPSMAAEQRELRERLTDALAQMGERCRTIFAMKLDGKSFAEIQAALRAGSINTVYTWDLRCRKQLLKVMGGSWSGRR